MATTKYRYARKLTPEEAVVVLEIREERGLREDLAAQMAQAGREYGFGIGPTSATSGIRHLMLVWDAPLDTEVLRRAKCRLDRDVDTISVAFSYPDLATSSASVPHIEAVKTQTKDRLNVIRPDRRTVDGHLVSNDKLIQTAIAETVRIRYQPHQISDRVPTEVVEQVRPFFLSASRRIAARHLWSRGPADGCLALRCADGVIVTATQTNKAPLELDRLVLVHAHDEASSTITYSGPALPSADCVELMVLAASRPDLDAFVHTHASRLITRNPRFTGGIRLGVRVSGEPALGHELASLLPEGMDCLVVLEEHGELFAGRRGDDAFFDWFDSVCDAAEQSLAPAPP